MPDSSLPLIGAAASGIGSLFGIFTGLHQAHLANQMHPQWQQYQTSPYAKQQLGLAQQLYNGIMPGYQQQQQNIANSQANYSNSVERNATDSAQALALEAGAQGTSNNAYSQLGQEQAQYKNSMLGNLNDAYKTMTEEGDKSYQSILQKYMMDAQTQNQLRGAEANNVVGGFNNIGSTLIAAQAYKNSQ